jgi:DNA-binding winged helix-turn-helix (wHTH) protein
LLFCFEDYSLDSDRRELWRGVSLIALEPQVFDLLEYLIRNRDRVVSRDDLIASIWGGRIVSESALSTRINAARSAIADSGAEQRLIRTLPRKGIRFVGTVREEQDVAKAAAADIAADLRLETMHHENKGVTGIPAIWPIAITAASVAVLTVSLIYQGGITRPVALSGANAALTTASTGEQNDRSRPLVPQTVPFIPDHQRAALGAEYLPAPDHKALAISVFRGGFVTAQKNEETAKAAALDACQQATDLVDPAARCEIYAIGNSVVSPRGEPPMPPEPWIVRDPKVETPFTVKDVPLINDRSRATLETMAKKDLTPWAVALGQLRTAAIFYNQSNAEEAMRRSLELCGLRSGAPCIIAIVDGVFVVPIPTAMKVVGLFHARSSNAVAQDAREDVAHRIRNAANGWHAVAVGTNGRPGLMLKAANEQSAIDGALEDCSKQDQACRVIAIGPFAVEPK